MASTKIPASESSRRALPARYAIARGRLYLALDDAGEVTWQPWQISDFPRHEARRLMSTYAPSVRAKMRLIPVTKTGETP